MGILHIEDRIILRCLDDGRKVEVHGRFRFAGQHHEANDVLSDFSNDIGQRDEIACALGHLDRLTRAQQPHDLHQLDVEPLPAFG